MCGVYAETEIKESKEVNGVEDLDIGVKEACRNYAKRILSMVFNHDSTWGISLCKACVEENLHNRNIPTIGRKWAKKPLELVHSDVCSKISTPSLGGIYFLTFNVDNTHYVWILLLGLMIE